MKKKKILSLSLASLSLLLFACTNNGQTGSTNKQSQSGNPTQSSKSQGGNASQSGTPSQSTGGASTPTSSAINPEEPFGQTFYVGVNENGGNGSRENPYNFYQLGTEARAGNTYLILDGNYEFSSRIELGKNFNRKSKVATGIAGAYITVKPETENTYIKMDFSKMTFDGANRGIQVYSDFWHISGLEVFGAGDNGMYISGNSNIIEDCVFYNNRDTGLQLGRGFGDDSVISLWPSYNLIKNCTSFCNFDDGTLGENADGFAAKLTVGFGNIFDGCIAFRNSDDGWDMYAKEDSGNIGTVSLYNCVSFENGYLPYLNELKDTSGKPITNTDGSPKKSYDTTNGDGIGFKLGGSVMEGDVIVENCMAFNNKLHGFGDNSNPGFLSLTNCTAYNNCAGLNDDGTISGLRGIKGLTNKSHNFDLARSSDSYNNYYGLLSFVNNQSNYDSSGDSEYNEDKFKGVVAYSIFNTGYDTKNKIEKYESFTGYVDASTYNDGEEDIAFARGKTYTGLSANSFADLTPINALCEDKADVKSLARFHKSLRNTDMSVNMGNKLKIVDQNLLTYANGNSIGAALDKTSFEAYTHPEYLELIEYDKTFSEAAIEAAFTVIDPITNLDATFQSFDLIKYVNDVNVTWESSNTDVIRIDTYEQISVSNSAFSKAIVTTPDQATKVTLTATLDYNGYTKTKTYEVNVLHRAQELGALSSSGTKTMRVNMYDSFNMPTIVAYDSSSSNKELLPDGYYSLDITYKYAVDGNSKKYAIDAIYTSQPGVYEVTALATKTSDENITSKYVFNVYVVDPDCSIDFVAETPTLGLSSDGFVITGAVSNVEGNVYAVVKDEAVDNISVSDIIEDATVQTYHITTDYISAPFVADNYNVKDSGKQYYVYYTVLNANQSNTAEASVRSFSADIVSINNEAEFHELARKNSIDGKTYNSTTIFKLEKDLDYTNFEVTVGEDVKDGWYLYDKTSVKPFSGLLNGNGHTVKNISVKGAVADKTMNIFYKVSNGTIMNINFDNISLIETDPNATGGNNGKLLGVVGDLQGGYLSDIKLSNFNLEGREGVGALVGQATGGVNYISRCQLVNNDSSYRIYATNKYASGLVGNAQANTGMTSLELHMDNCAVIGTIGALTADGSTGIDAGGCVGGILGRVKNDKEFYITDIKNCFYSGLLIANGNYNGGIVGSFEAGSGHTSIYNNISICEIQYKDKLFSGEVMFNNSQEDDTSLHKNSNPVVGRAVTNAIGIYESLNNIGTFNEYYSKVIKSRTIYFDLLIDPEGEARPYEFTELMLTATLKFDLENIWNVDYTNKTKIIMTLK